MLSNEVLIKRLSIDEGRRSRPYVDSVGKKTIGIGRNISDRQFSHDEALALGIGRDFNKDPLTDAEMDMLCSNDIDDAFYDMDAYNWFYKLDDARAGVCICMMFNLGPGRFSDFKHFAQYMAIKDWSAAAGEMANSLWAKQVGNRAVVYERIIRDGVWE